LSSSEALHITRQVRRISVSAARRPISGSPEIGTIRGAHRQPPMCDGAIRLLLFAPYASPSDHLASGSNSNKISYLHPRARKLPPARRCRHAK